MNRDEARLADAAARGLALHAGYEPDAVRDLDPGSRLRGEAAALIAAVLDAAVARIEAAVFGLHVSIDGRNTWCRECDKPYPCPTVRVARGEPLDTIREQVSRGRWPLA